MPLAVLAALGAAASLLTLRTPRPAAAAAPADDELLVSAK